MYAVFMERYGAGAVARHNLNQHLIEQVCVDRPRPRAENAEVTNEEAVAVRGAINNAIQRRSEVVMRIADAQPEQILLVWPIVKAGKHVVQAVRIIEDAVVAREDRFQRRIVQRRKTRRNAVGKADQERIARSFERIDIAKLVRSLAGELLRAVCS